ncbi:hypothetical protein ACF061_16560 [Streptomyces sp. NPDC015220]|uniref:hypothetical protein n=1 Tax=Streptomyces sp. NPDC015220 TaxID=3364947 RepID=UPI0037025AD7
MMKIKAAIVAAAAVAGLAVATAPAQANECGAEGGGRYICEYGVSEHQLPEKGRKEQFVVGTDYAVWTRVGKDGTWGRWVSLGGVARSKVIIESGYQNDDFITRVNVFGTDGSLWFRFRPEIGESWTPWDKR